MTVFFTSVEVFLNKVAKVLLIFRYFIDKDLVARVPSVFYTLALVYGIMQAIGLITVCNPPNPVGEQFKITSA